MMENIFLCGFMGCGKTTVGLELAKMAGMQYLDLDEYIENTKNMKIPEIFSRYGEPRFREIESLAVKKISMAFTNTVVACGGGAMLNPVNAKNARNSGNVILLDVPFETCYNRIKDDINRPLVVNNTAEQLHQLYKKRYPIYEKSASITISINENDTPIEIANIILQSL